MNHRGICLLLAAACLLLSGCSLERGYSSVEPHENRYWESNDNDILRAESYQDFVNAILLLVEQHEETGTIRLYLSDVDYSTALTLVKNACTEVREDTATGSYCLETLDFDMEELRDSYYQVQLLPEYRRTAEDLEAIVETASSSAIYELLIAAYEEGRPSLTVRYAYLAEERETLLANILQLQLELEGVEAPPEEAGEQAPVEEGAEILPQRQLPEGRAPWEIHLYPPEGDSSIIEIFLQPQEAT